MGSSHCVCIYKKKKIISTYRSIIVTKNVYFLKVQINVFHVTTQICKASKNVRLEWNIMKIRNCVRIERQSEQ